MLNSKFFRWTKLSKLNNSDISFKRGLKNVSFISSANLISQFIGFIGFIFIARLFGPKNFGMYTTVMAFVTFFHLFLFGGLSKAVVREGSRKIESFDQVLESTSGMRILFIILALFLCIGTTLFTNYSNTIKFLIIIFSSEIIYYGIDSFINTTYQITEKMEYMAYFSVLTRLTVTAFSIAFLYLGSGVLGILIVNLLCKFIILVIKFFHTRRIVKFNVSINFDVKHPLLKATVMFSLISFINTLAVKVDILMISFLSTSTDVGIYAIAHEISKEGLMLRNAITTAFFPIAVKFLSKNSIKIKTLFTYALVLFLVVLAGCFLLSCFAQDVVVLLLGTKYDPSGHILSCLIFYLCFSFFSLPFTTYLQASHNEHLLIIVYTITVLTNIPLNIILFYKFGLLGIAYSTIIVFFVQCILVSFLTARKMRTKKKST